MYLNVHCSTIYRASPIAQLVKNRLQSATQETLVQFLGWEDPLEKVWRKGNALALLVGIEIDTAAVEIPKIKLGINLLL